MRLKDGEGWNQVVDDWRIFLDLNPDGCFVAVCEGAREFSAVEGLGTSRPSGHGQVIGTVTTLRYGRRVSWISMLLVDPAFRRIGIATRLLQRAITHLADCETIWLDATPAGRPLYERLGFVPEMELLRMGTSCVPDAGGIESGDSVPIAERDWARIVALDGPVFGTNRSAVLRALRERAPDLAWMQTREGKLAGFCLGRRGSWAGQIGPIVAASAQDAMALCQACARGLAGRPAVIDVPVRQDSFIAWLGSQGFVEQRVLTRMALGGERMGMHIERQFAIAGPELG
jgi:GNAT superfamily N-acetyltransferase